MKLCYDLDHSSPRQRIAYSGEAWVECEMPSVYERVHPAGSGMPSVLILLRPFLLFPSYFLPFFSLSFLVVHFVVDFCNLYPAHSFIHHVSCSATTFVQ